jgi:hypothetical protein
MLFIVVLFVKKTKYYFVVFLIPLLNGDVKGLGGRHGTNTTPSFLIAKSCPKPYRGPKNILGLSSNYFEGISLLQNSRLNP